MDCRKRSRSNAPLYLASAVALALAAPANATEVPHDGDAVPGKAHKGCDGVDARACVDQAMTAMGGRQKLSAIGNVHYQTTGHAALTEQSYRQQPFITAYERDDLTLDFDKGRLVRVAHVTWPESDPHQSEVTQTLVATPHSGVYRGEKADSPCSLADLDTTRDALALGPERLLLNASAVSDLHYAPSQWLRGTAHSVVEFTWEGAPIRVLLNASNHLPDAMESTRTFHDFWYAWGDVRQRVYFDNWHLFQGLVLPTNLVEVRNDVPWQSTQILDARFNDKLDDKTLAMDAAVASKSAQSKGWDRSFSDKARIELAPGIELYRGSWSTTLIKQDDGVLVLEAPISSTFAQGIFAKARSEYPDTPIKGVLTSSDSWPHMAGIREAVAEGLPVYALDLNRPLLERLVSSPHSLRPDALQTQPKAPRWMDVANKTEIGHGANRVVLYPLRGASTERQYMVYFPQHHLLYASDTLALNADHSLYDPQLMHEVVQAVEREHLQVDTVYAMHEGPTPWSDVLKLVRTAAN
ncbi:hypothetical protein [Dyella humicola]|uniref:hypothetical protein n=1 Tax=Dyella humicola TaxID=2992126 RepID=UPI0022559DFF|nr:hypothetical protein [Dyella humicola]